jgi:hypothetical protein
MRLAIAIALFVCLPAPLALAYDDPAEKAAVDALHKVTSIVKPNAQTGKIEFVNFWKPGVTDEHLVYVGELKSIKRLFLGKAVVTDAGLEHIKDLTHMEYLQMGGQQKITDKGLVNLKGMRSLNFLGLNNTPISDAGLVHLKDLRHLTTLQLNNTRVTDAGLEHLKGMSSLETLYLANLPRVSDAGLDHLKDLTGLKMLFLNGTPVTSAGIEKLRQTLKSTDIRK